MMSVGALGIVYGDIGTTLYAFRETFHAAEGLPVVRESVLGVFRSCSGLWSWSSRSST